MSRYIDKDKLLNRLCGNDISRMSQNHIRILILKKKLLIDAFSDYQKRRVDFIPLFFLFKAKQC